MTRSPLAYPLNRGADTDVGGAADLQTDVMRFMAILSLCLVAIFALVQSMPLSSPPPALPTPGPVTESAHATTVMTEEPLPPAAVTRPAASIVEEPLAEALTLTRPKWRPSDTVSTNTATDPATLADIESPALPEQPEGFTLRFESDLALSRLVAAGRIGVYAIQGEVARRMAVSNSRISFWDASFPNSFHEMESSTVPAAAVTALAQAGVEANTVRWGVTLPGSLKKQLDDLMQSNKGGSLIIGAGGDIRLEAP